MEALVELKSLQRVLHGVSVATKASDSLVKCVATSLERLEAKHNSIDGILDGGIDPQPNSTNCTRTIEWWKEQLTTQLESDSSSSQILIDVVLGVVCLREISRKRHEITTEQLDSIWQLLFQAITSAQTSDLQFTVSRSAQGFLAVPLCSLLRDGKIEELWRFHVWLPDRERGLSQLGIHAHQTFAQSWILMGSGTDCGFDVQACPDKVSCTHAIYELRWNAAGSTGSKAYHTHQISSTISNTGKLVKATQTRTERHSRDDSYEIAGGTFHKSIVPSGRLHATLFVFDSIHGFDEDAGVLGPPDDSEFTQLRDSAGISAATLASVVDASRKWEQLNNHVRVDDGEEHPTVLAYFGFFRGLELLRQGKSTQAAEYLSPTTCGTPAQAFEKDSCLEHANYLRKLVEAEANFDLADASG